MRYGLVARHRDLRVLEAGDVRRLVRVDLARVRVDGKHDAAGEPVSLTQDLSKQGQGLFH